MANVSSSNSQGELVPKLRFPGFEGSWELQRLGDVIVPYSEKVFGAHNYDILTSSRDGIRFQEEHFTEKQRHDTDGYNIIPKGYCTYRNRSDDGRFAFNLNNISEHGIVSKFYPVFSFSEADSIYITSYLNNCIRAKKELSVLAVGTSQVVLSFETLKTAMFPMPNYEEQRKIGCFIQKLDQRIDAQRRLVDALKSYKRGVIQRIFSNADNTNSWSKIRIKDLFDNIIEKNHPEEVVLTIIQGFGTVPRDSVDRRISYDSSSVSTYKKVNKDDFIMHLRSFEGGLEIANQNGIVSPAYTILRSKQVISPSFFYAYFRSYEFINNKLRPAVEGIRDGKSINMETFWNLVISLPPIEKQNFYAVLFDKLDKAIGVSEKDLCCLEDVKRYIFQQMFI